MIYQASTMHVPVDLDRSIAEIVRQRAEQQGEDTALVYLRDGEHNIESCPYRELWARISRIVAAL